MKRIFLKNLRMIDGKGNPAVEDAILIYNSETEKIEYAGSSKDAPKPKNIRVIDCNGYTIMPGLCNVHTHLNCTLPFKPYRVNEFSAGYNALMAYRRAAEALMIGVTTIRGAGDRDFSDVAIRDAIDKKMLFGPNIIPCAGMIIAHNGHQVFDPITYECSGVSEFRKTTRLMIKAGASVIKICMTGGMSTKGEGYTDPQMTDDEITAVVEVAHMANRRVMAHLGGDKSIQNAVRLGIDTIEHGYVMSNETVNMIKEADRWLVPTMAATHSIEFLEKHNAQPYQLEKTKAGQAGHAESIRRAYEAGVKMACGTDMLPSDPLGGTNVSVREAELLVEVIGFKPLEAIKALTYNGADCCGIGDITGSLETGKLADLYICQGKPDIDIKDLRNLRMVVKSGNLVWSKIPGYEIDAYNIVQPNLECSGATFIKW